MKFIYAVIVLCFLTIESIAQISPALKAGIGYVHVFDIDESKSPDVHPITGYPTLSVEKPFPIEIRLKKRLSINPGLAYNFFKEKEIKGDQTKGKDFRLNHQSINGYVKLLYQTRIAGASEAFVYAGGIGGMHFITKTKGTKITYGLNIETPLIEVDVNENGIDFFEMFYYGAVAGFQPNARRHNYIKPSFEISYYPGFVTKTNETLPITYSNLNTIQFSLFLGFRIN